MTGFFYCIVLASHERNVWTARNDWSDRTSGKQIGYIPSQVVADIIYVYTCMYLYAACRCHLAINVGPVSKNWPEMQQKLDFIY